MHGASVELIDKKIVSFRVMVACGLALPHHKMAENGAHRAPTTYQTISVESSIHLPRSELRSV
jgi:hypothetical protein